MTALDGKNYDIRAPFYGTQLNTRQLHHTAARKCKTKWLGHKAFLKETFMFHHLLLQNSKPIRMNTFRNFMNNNSIMRVKFFDIASKLGLQFDIFRLWNYRLDVSIIFTTRLK